MKNLGMIWDQNGKFQGRRVNFCPKLKKFWSNLAIWEQFWGQNEDFWGKRVTFVVKCGNLSQNYLFGDKKVFFGLKWGNLG